MEVYGARVPEDFTSKVVEVFFCIAEILCVSDVIPVDGLSLYKSCYITYILSLRLP